jgi:subtilisin family serine protease
MYGVSYFSSTGPTLDGRVKPDVVAPGERIVSCATGANIRQLADDGKNGVYYIEMSGTSMATAHVSGACAKVAPSRWMSACELAPSR